MSLKKNGEEPTVDEDETSSLGSASTADTTTRSITPTLNGLRSSHKKRGRKKKHIHPSLQYNFSCYLKEQPGDALFGVSFNHNINKSDVEVFAAVGKNRVTIFECPEGTGIIPVQCYADPDASETFYTCAWSYDRNGNALIAVGGSRGVIRIINPAIGQCTKHFIGHGEAINDLKFHPNDPNLLLSVSKDHTLRLWNIRTDICIAIFGGVEGHRDEVLSADFDLSGEKIVSCGMDHSLKLWRLDRDLMRKCIQHSYQTVLMHSSRPFNTLDVHFPDFSTRDIHTNYVDCVKWLGDFVMSKSLENCIAIWKPGRIDDKELRNNETNVTLITKLKYKDGEIWYLRFATDFWLKILALGTQNGDVYLWDLDVPDFHMIQSQILSHPKCNATVRQTSFSRDGSILICVCDDGTIWRWNRTPQ